MTSRAGSIYGTAKWKAIRKTVLAEEPTCHWCKRAPSTQADHLVEIARGLGMDAQAAKAVLDVDRHAAQTQRSRESIAHPPGFTSARRGRILCRGLGE